MSNYSTKLAIFRLPVRLVGFVKVRSGAYTRVRLICMHAGIYSLQINTSQDTKHIAYMMALPKPYELRAICLSKANSCRVLLSLRP